MTDNTWIKIYDESIDDKYGKYMGLIDNDCIDIMDN